jgi:hypothetical protein
MANDPADPVGDAYARWHALSDSCTGDAPIITVAELSRRSLAGSSHLSVDERRAIMASRALRESWSHLNMKTNGWMPALAAASTSHVEQRPFAGGALEIVPSAKAGRLFITIRCSLNDFAPTRLEVTGPSGEFLQRQLPPSRAPGEYLLLLDLASADDQRLASLLRDPRSMGQLHGT